MADQDDVGQIVIDDEIDYRPRRFCIADLLVDAFAVTGNSRRKSGVSQRL